jgi:hypothetical protein
MSEEEVAAYGLDQLANQMEANANRTQRIAKRQPYYDQYQQREVLRKKTNTANVNGLINRYTNPGATLPYSPLQAPRAGGPVAGPFAAWGNTGEPATKVMDAGDSLNFMQNMRYGGWTPNEVFGQVNTGPLSQGYRKFNSPYRNPY